MTTKNNSTKTIKPLSVKIYFISVVTLALAGIIVSGYLSYSHFKIFTDIEYQSFCAISKAINCETVSQSKYAVILNVPVAIWGMAGYFLLLTAILFSVDFKNNKMKNVSTLLTISFLYSAISLLLGIISSVLIQAYCLMCIASWIINFALLYLFWLIRRRYETCSLINSFKFDFEFCKQNKQKVIPAILAIGTLGVFLISFYPNYWNYELSVNHEQLKTGLTKDGHPWIGAENPKLTIIEFSDYLCFQCKKMHFFLRNLVSKYPEKLRLVHRHFPMDHSYNPIVKKSLHPGAGILSLIALSSVEENGFWKTNDYLFNYDLKNSAILLRQIASDLNIDLKKLQLGINKKENQVKLSNDIIFGLKKKFVGTPSYIINDQVYIGQIPIKIIRSLDK